MSQNYDEILPANYGFDLDNQDDEAQPFAWREGDVVLCCVEDTRIKKGPKGPYAFVQLVVIDGPLNRPEVDAGPRGGGEHVFARRVKDNLSFSTNEFARSRVKSFLRALGHAGQVNLGSGTNAAEAWAKLILDREVRVEVRLESVNDPITGLAKCDEKGQVVMRPKVVAYASMTEADGRAIGAVYDRVGSALDGRWMPKDDGFAGGGSKSGSVPMPSRSAQHDDDIPF